MRASKLPPSEPREVVPVMPTVTRYVGIDPGAHTGLVCVDSWHEPRTPGVSPGGRKYRLVDHRRISVPVRKNLTPAERRGMFALSVRDQLVDWCTVNGGWLCAQVILERPADRTDEWTTSRAPTPGENAHAGYKRGTAFGLGNAYGLLEAAVAFAGLPMTCYTVREWMPTQRSGRYVHTMRRDTLRALLHSLSQEAGATAPLSVDELMAFGVLFHHLTRVVDATPQLPMFPPAVSQ